MHDHGEIGRPLRWAAESYMAARYARTFGLASLLWLMVGAVLVGAAFPVGVVNASRAAGLTLFLAGLFCLFLSFAIAKGRSDRTRG